MVEIGSLFVITQTDSYIRDVPKITRKGYLSPQNRSWPWEASSRFDGAATRSSFSRLHLVAGRWLPVRSVAGTNTWQLDICTLCGGRGRHTRVRHTAAGGRCYVPRLQPHEEAWIHTADGKTQPLTAGSYRLLLFFEILSLNKDTGFI